MQRFVFSKIEHNLIIFFDSLWFGYLILHNLLSGRFWAWNAFSIIPPIAFILFTLLLTILTILIYIKVILNFGRKSFLILTILILNISLSLFLSDLNFNALLPRSEYDSDEVITVFNLNTHFWEGPTFREDFLQFLVDQEADIYVLQEFIPYYPVNSITFENFHDMEIAVIEELFPEYDIAYEGEYLFIYKDNIEVINGSRAKGEYFFKIDLEINSEIISFYSVHIPVQFFGRNTGAAAEVKDLRDKFNLRDRALDQLVQSIESIDTPYFISGDFNSTKSMGVMNRIFKLANDSISASKTFYPATWKIKDLRLWRIDYTLASPELKFVDHEYVDAGSFSDHYGILSRFEL